MKFTKLSLVLLLPLLFSSRAVADDPEQQVYVSAIILEVELGPDLEHGIDLLRRVDELNPELGKRIGYAASLVSDPPPVRIVPSKVGVKRGVPSAEYLNAYVEALQNTERCRVISRPFVYTGDGQAATISSGQQVALPTTTTVTPAPGDSNRIEFRTVGMELDILPKVRRDRVQLEVGYTSSRLDAGGGISEQQLETKVEIGEGEVVVLGGPIEERAVEREILGTIPVVKRIVGTKQSRFEHLIMLQPLIVRPEDQPDSLFGDKPGRRFEGTPVAEPVEPIEDRPAKRSQRRAHRRGNWRR